MQTPAIPVNMQINFGYAIADCLFSCLECAVFIPVRLNAFGAAIFEAFGKRVDCPAIQNQFTSLHRPPKALLFLILQFISHKRRPELVIEG